MRPTEDLSVLDRTEPFDVCIIGSGFAGTVLGCALTASGLNCLILESGKTVAHWFADRRLRDLAAYQVRGDTDYPSERTKARIVGGNSSFWTGRCERFHPSDFATHSLTPSTNPWPIGYGDLQPYYQMAETTLAVRGGRLSEHTPPRVRELPVTSRSNLAGLRDLLSRAGVTVDESPTATPSRAMRFFRLQKEVLPRFFASSTGVLLKGTTVVRLDVDADGRVVGAVVKTLAGERKQARARFYVAACGGLETPRLLLLSRSTSFPNGIGNSYDRVGRGFNEHPGVNFYGSIRHSRSTLVPRHSLGRSHQFYDDFRAEGLGSVLPVFIQSIAFPNHLMQHSAGELVRNAGAVLKRVVQPALYIGASVEMKPRDENRLTLADGECDAFGNPLGRLEFSFSNEDRETLDRARSLIRRIFSSVGASQVREGELTWSRHHIGTCRMGTNPATSVTDPQLKVHGTPNLFLCGAETFVTGTALPPVLTIVALAHRLSEHLIERLRYD